ncbi:MAG: hypothetical protein K0S08_1440 [Gammaproteobacteria bacterium]|jgi:hypothetical protein|nr:hypothetical protein [Gammaproteobacteria bacterium]
MKMNKIVLLSALLGLGHVAFSQEQYAGGDLDGLAAPAPKASGTGAGAVINEALLDTLAADHSTAAFFAATNDKDIRRAAATINIDAVTRVFPQTGQMLAQYESTFGLKQRREVLGQALTLVRMDNPDKVVDFQLVLQKLKAREALTLQDFQAVQNLDGLYAAAVSQSARDLLKTQAQTKRQDRRPIK